LPQTVTAPTRQLQRQTRRQMKFSATSLRKRCDEAYFFKNPINSRLTSSGLSTIIQCDAPVMRS
jgi:hypothetical protein